MAKEPVDPKIEAEWRKLLVEGHRSLKVAHVLFRHLPHEPRCKLCHNPFGGIGGKIVGLAGYRPSPKNPNLCRQCCDGLPPGGAEVDIAVLFADVRGSTGLGTQLESAEYVLLMNRFYVAATRALIKHDAIIDKLIGDEVMALFIPGICGQDYRWRATQAALDLLEAVGSADDPWLSVGVGLHAGPAYVGNVGAEGMMDFTALGDTVNIAARLQHVAGPGEVAITDPIYDDIREHFPDAVAQEVTLRGREQPLAVRTLRVR
jgi:adenylate cyclase